MPSEGPQWSRDNQGGPLRDIRPHFEQALISEDLLIRQLLWLSSCARRANGPQLWRQTKRVLSRCVS